MLNCYILKSNNPKRLSSLFSNPKIVTACSSLRAEYHIGTYFFKTEAIIKYIISTISGEKPYNPLETYLRIQVSEVCPNSIKVNVGAAIKKGSSRVCLLINQFTPSMQKIV